MKNISRRSSPQAAGVSEVSQEPGETPFLPLQASGESNDMQEAKADVPCLNFAFL